MAGGVKVGTGYIDIRLGDLSQFWGKLKSEVERTGKQVGKQLGDKISKFNVDKNAFRSLQQGLVQAIKSGDQSLNDLRTKLAATGKQGADSFLREFGPLLRKGIANSSIEGRDEMLQAFDAGQISPRLARTLNQALQGIFDELPAKAAAAGTRTGNSFAQGVSAGFRSFQTAVGNAGHAVDRLGQRIGLLGFQITNIGHIASVAFTAPTALLTTLAGAVGLKTASAIEDATVAFTTMLGTKPKAEAFLKVIRDFAAESPIFDVDNVIDFTKKLLGAGVAQKQVIPTLTALSSIAAAYGLDQEQLNRALRGFTQSLLLGKVYQEELNQITESGIPIYDLLAQAFGKTKKEIQKLVADKKISPEQLFNAIVKLGNSGKYLDGLNERANTLTGTWQRFKETLQSRLADALEGQLPRIKQFLSSVDDSLGKILSGAAPFFDRVLDNVEKLVRGLGMLADWYSKLTPAQQGFVADVVLLLAALGPVVIVVGALVTAIGGLASALGFLLSPVGLVVLGVAALAAGFLWAYKKVDNFRAVVNEVWTAIQGWWAVAKPPLEDLWNYFKEKLTPAVKELRDWFVNEFLPALEEFVNYLAAEVQPRVKEVAEYWRDVLKPAIDAVVIAIEEHLIPALKGAVTWWKENKNELEPLIELMLVFLATSAMIAGFIVGVLIVALALCVGMLAFFMSWIFRVASAVLYLIQVMRAWWQVLWEVAKAIWEWVSSAQRAVDTVIAVFAGLPGAIASVLSSLGGILFDAGANAVQGLINGLLSRLGAVQSAASALANAARVGLDAILRFGSPSKEAQKWGGWVVEGFIKGMESRTPLVEPAMAGIVPSGVDMRRMAAPEPTTSNVNYNIYPQQANWTVQHMRALQREEAARSRAGRPR